MIRRSTLSFNCKTIELVAIHDASMIAASLDSRRSFANNTIQLLSLFNSTVNALTRRLLCGLLIEKHQNCGWIHAPLGFRSYPRQSHGQLTNFLD
jgi:hypothetical protein